MKKPKQPRPPRLTDAERHERFLEVARKVGASTRRSDLDSVIRKITKAGKPQ